MRKRIGSYELETMRKYKGRAFAITKIVGEHKETRVPWRFWICFTYLVKRLTYQHSHHTFESYKWLAIPFITIQYTYTPS